MAPTVSVIIPTFNRSSCVTNAIESVLRQTYTDFEIVVVDDGSTDNTRERLEPYMPRIRYAYQQNRGASAAQNKGVALAAGEWVSVLGDDDEWLPTKLERQFDALAKFREECGACFTDSQFMVGGDLRETMFAEGGFKVSDKSGILKDWLRYECEGYPIIGIQSLLVRRSLFNEIGGFDESMVINEDLDLIFRLALKTRLCFVSDPLVRIDRTLSQSRLTDLIEFWNEAQFCSRAYMYAKWLGLSAADLETHARITEIRRQLFYDWMVRKIRHFQISGAIQKAAYLRDLGDGRLLILSTLMMRGSRKIIRSLERGRRAK
jgi:glycosyltransferase involved in cell wall biosynthesis